MQTPPALPTHERIDERHGCKHTLEQDPGYGPGLGLWYTPGHRTVELPFSFSFREQSPQSRTHKVDIHLWQCRCDQLSP